MERVVVSRPFIGICFSQVCCVKDATNEEILNACNSTNPSGTSNGWSKVHRKHKEHPVCQCADDPDRVHILVSC